MRRLRQWYWSRFFPAPVQVRLMQILGGTTITIGRLRYKNRPMTIVLSRGRLLRSRRFRRMVLDGQGVLASDVKWAIAIEGKDYERNVIAAYEKDERLEAAGWYVIYIRARDIWNRPQAVRNRLKPLFR